MNNGDLQIGQVLERAGVRIKLSAVLLGICWWIVTCLGIWFVLFILDNLLRLPAGLRLPLAIGGAALAAAGFIRKIYAIAAIKQRAERTAVMLEKKYEIPENILINSCQFERQKLRPEEVRFAQNTIQRGLTFATSISFADLWNKKELLRWGSAAGILLVLWAGYLLLFPSYALNAGGRFVAPLADRPPVASIGLEVTPSGDVALVEGQNLEVTATVRGVRAEGTVSPVLIWKEGTTAVEPLRTEGQTVPMVSGGKEQSQFTYTFTEVHRPFAFRIFAADAYSRSVQVSVRPLPRLKESLFRVTPPAYVGLVGLTNPGPPAAVTVLPGSQLEVIMAIEPGIRSGVWKEADTQVELSRQAKYWRASISVTNAGEYEIQILDADLKKNVTIARGALRLENDNPPEIDFVTDDRNRLVNLGSTLKLEIAARDDYGIQIIDITTHTADQEDAATVLKRWNYMGPPGNKGPLKESYALLIDPAIFKPETTYLLVAQARDFRPGAAPAKSRPIMLRVKSLNDYNLASNDPLAAAFAALKETIARQEKANGRTLNLKTYLEEALKNKTLPDRQKEMATRQDEAKKSGAQTVAAFAKVADGKLYAGRLEPLVEGEMKLVLGDIAKLAGTKLEALKTRLITIEDRQTYILTELIALLGKIAEDKQMLAKTNRAPKEADTTPVVTPQEFAKDLADDLKKFISEQERILERSKMLLDKGPEDLTEKDEQILGELAREEAEWAKFFEEKLTDFSKLPQQDFADKSISKEVNEVWMDVKQAEKSLYDKKMELAVPQEQSVLENAKTLENNLEKWLPDKPDMIKWNMEEPMTPADIALAELPAELEDIVGELIDKEEEMTQDVEDVSSPWLDSLDKGAGWDAMDGPISSMSAKGVTGNQLPNQMEIGGRSGEGRSGRSSGQMVEETAEGKGGRETPTRVSPTPFEQGSVKDSDTKSKGGATGGGKLSGTGAEGLRGPNAPQTAQKLPRLADQQAKIRQQAEALALRLRQYHLPSGELEGSIHSMKRFETAARKGDGLNVRRSFSRALDALSDAKKSIRVETGLHRERVKLPEWMRDEIKVGLQDGVPKGYEEMIGEYFKAMAETKGK